MKYRNIGPISGIDIQASFNSDGSPKPLLLVGENGSGKSTVISNVVDSFYLLAQKSFSNAMIKNEDGYSFFKVLSNIQIKSGENFLLSRIVFDNNIEYFFKSGICSLDKFKSESGFTGRIKNWQDNENRKEVIGGSDDVITKLFSEQIFCYFGPERYEKPNWLGKSYYEALDSHLSIEPKLKGKLVNDICPHDMGKGTLKWLLDVIVDSRVDIEFKNNSVHPAHFNNNVAVLYAMTVARTNVEKIMSEILNEDVYFGLNLRQKGIARFNVKRKKDDSIVAPSIDSLSTGQLALFNIFSTIIRYADNNDITKSFTLNSIKGIVVVDEIELHLHSIHQKEVLPRLMKLFPNVQFIISSHSPLFLLGVNEIYKENGFDIYQLPEGHKIGPELFSEFTRAYQYFLDTKKHHEQIREAIDHFNTKEPLVITEGASDWKHLLAAFNNLSKKDEYKDIFEGLSIEFFKYEPKNNSKPSDLIKLDMGNTALVTMCEDYSKINQTRKMIFIADCDDKATNDIFMEQGKLFKSWGNNVFSFTLPVPDTRKDTPEICIEHLYKDTEIKTEHEENGISRRLYMGNEFNNKGISKELEKFCDNRKLCGRGKISIIEGSSREKVTDLFDDEKNVNYALSKMKFSEYVLNSEPGFDNFDFSNFVEIFRIIKKIVSSSETI